MSRYALEWAKRHPAETSQVKAVLLVLGDAAQGADHQVLVWDEELAGHAGIGGDEFAAGPRTPSADRCAHLRGTRGRCARLRTPANGNSPVVVDQALRRLEADALLDAVDPERFVLRRPERC
jgi:hypothetical protein